MKLLSGMAAAVMSAMLLAPTLSQAEVRMDETQYTVAVGKTADGAKRA